MNARTFALQHGWNELKHDAEQLRLCELVEQGWTIVSTGSLPDRIVYVLTKDEKRLKDGVTQTANNRFMQDGKFISSSEAYE